MRIVLAGILMLALASTPAVSGDPDEQTVALLVPAGSNALALQGVARGDVSIGWERIEVPLTDTVERTIAEVERQLGTDVFVDEALPLLAGQDEPVFGEQWALENTGQQGGVNDADIDAIEAWATSTGAGVVVAVIDSGVQSNHPEMANQMWRNEHEAVNGVDDDGNGHVDDVHGWDFLSGDNDPLPVGSGPDEAHGTFVAGIVAAEVNGVGMAGVAPDARIMNLRACHEGSCLTSDAIAAMFYAVENGADIINLSFGGPAQSIDMGSPLAQAISFAGQHDVLVVTAAGNTPPEDMNPGEVILPAEYPHSNNVAVAATTRFDAIGGDSYYSGNVDIAAPGYEILSTSLVSFAVGSGTSYAAPHVAGAAALLKALDADMTPDEVAERLRAAADTPADISGKVQSGRLNAGNALPIFIDIFGNTFEQDIEWAEATGVTKGCNPPSNSMFCPDDTVTRGQMAAFIKRYLGLPAASGDHFGDDSGSTFEDDINRLAEAGITKGCNPPANDRFCPDDPVTREQMAAFLVRALDLTQDDHPGFADVPADNTFVGDIDRLATAGITRGCNPPVNSNFCPADEVTRGQMTAFLHRAEP